MLKTGRKNSVLLTLKPRERSLMEKNIVKIESAADMCKCQLAEPFKDTITTITFNNPKKQRGCQPVD